MGGNIQDAFGGIGPIYYQWQLPVLNIILIIGTMVKITDDNAKEAQVQKH
jgi:K(+)-stimulated pyrophosphate-energized sodium pump